MVDVVDVCSGGPSNKSAIAIVDDSRIEEVRVVEDVEKFRAKF